MASIMEVLDQKLGNEKKSMTITEALGKPAGVTIDKALEDFEGFADNTDASNNEVDNTDASDGE